MLIDDQPRMRLCRGLATVADSDRLVVEGAASRHTFGGRAATEILPNLLPLLDGTRSRSQLAIELGLTESQLSQAMAILEARGLLEVADSAKDSRWPSTEPRDFFSRTLSAMGGYRGTGELLDVLARAAIHVTGDKEASLAVAEDLAAAGLGRVSLGAAPPAKDDAQSLLRAQRSLVLLLEDTSDPESLLESVAWCRQRGVPVLRAAATAGHLELGPSFCAGTTACPRCLWRSRQDAGWSGPVAPGAAATEVMAGLAAAEALSIIARPPSASVPQALTRFALDDWTTERYVAVPYPECQECGGWSPDNASAEAYEWLMTLCSTCLPPHDGQAPSRRDSLAKLPTHRPEYWGHPRGALPDSLRPVRGAYGLPDPSVAVVDVSEPVLADIMRRVAGRRPESGDSELQRWTPTGGNLASVELYLITERSMSGLPGTIFRYDDLAHELIAVMPDRVPLSSALAGTDLTVGRGASVVVLVAAHKRLAAKYGEFATRLAHLDAGCAATQLYAVAQGHGLRVEFATGWDHRLAELLGVANDEQFITLVAGLLPGEADGDEACR